MLVDFVSGMIKQSRGQFFTVEYQKLDGTVRKMNGRIGVTKYLKHMSDEEKVENSFAPWSNRITMYDVKQKGYRTFYCDRVLGLNIRHFRLTEDRI
jgi:hypothetical protein